MNGTQRVEVVWPVELVERIDAARGDVPRAKFMLRAMESALRVPEIDSLGPNPSLGLVKAAALNASVQRALADADEPSMRQGYVEGAFNARAVAMERQQRLNADRDKKRKS